MSCHDCNPTGLSYIAGPAGPAGPQGPQGEPGASGASVYIGKTLYVSTLGDDATAVPYSVGAHYRTITAAKTAAASGDVVVVFPDVYAESGLQKDGIKYYFMPGASVNTSATIFDITTETMIIDGHGDFITSSGSVVANSGGTIQIAAKSMSSTSNASAAVYTTGGTTTVNLQQDQIGRAHV